MRQVLLAIIGGASGFAVSAGVFALITALSLIPRMADKTHTGQYVKSYETCVLTGGLFGIILFFLNINGYDVSLCRLLEDMLPVNDFLIELLFVQLPIAFCGIFIGIFGGTLSVSIAENLDVLAVFRRRTKLHYGTGAVILSFAVGKALGSFLFFYKEWF